MASLIVAAEAQRDIAAILIYLRREAGFTAAAEYSVTVLRVVHGRRNITVDLIARR